MAGGVQNSMSGICAVCRSTSPESVRAILASMNGGLSPDGLESCGYENEGAGGVGVASRFREQQVYGGPRVLLACDAELINAEELAAMVGRPMDTAALLAALYERFGVSFVEKLRGGFSVVLWDRSERLLLAAIDGFGIKRLAYYQDEKGVLVASRVDALARSGQVDTAINPRAIANVLNFSANLGPETIFQKVRRLVPGTILLASTTATRLESYWDIRYGLGADFNEKRLSREMESVVERSVAAHCGRDSFQDIGAFLSGGTDSSTVVGMMTRAAQAPVKAFSIGFEEQPFNELGYAELAAKHFGAQHYTYLVGPGDCFEALPRMVRCFDEPYGNSSAIPTYFCARLAAQNGVRVLLAGDGGDELFGGNERYATDKIFEIYHRVPGVFRKGLIEPIAAVLPGNGGLAGRARGYIRRANIRGVERMLSFQFLRTHPPETVFEADFLAALGDYNVIDLPVSHYQRASARDHLDKLLYVDMKITLADNDLPKVTQMAELAGIQTRFPFLDRAVAEFSGRVPARLKVKGFDKRYLFKRAFRNLLPAEIIRKKKHGFGIPVAVWMKTDPRMRELTYDTLLSASAASRGYFRKSFIDDLFRRHESEDTTYYGDTLWTFLSLELWHQQALRETAKAAS
jgi:asparagine synthase (glutamine-hydrolysing)